MSRYLLDTNIVIFLLSGQEDEVANDVKNIIDDYSNQIYVSAITLMELSQLYRIGKINPKNYKSSEAMIKAIEGVFYFTILPFGAEQAQTLSKLQITDGHNDPFDHAIISQAITEKLILVSSDGKFKDYTPQKLKFVFNKR